MHGTLRIFLCDDNPHYRKLSRVVLEELHEIVGEASDGAEAVALAPAAAPEVVLLDLKMPGVGGYEALPHLRDVLPAAKIIILTSGRADDELLRAKAAGADGFVSKPRSVFELPDAMAKAVTSGFDQG